MDKLQWCSTDAVRVHKTGCWHRTLEWRVQILRTTLLLCEKYLGTIYSSVNHAVLPQQELGQGLKQRGRESVVCFLERIQETFSQAYGSAVSWSAHHGTTLIEFVVNRRLADLIPMHQIPVPFSFINFRGV